MNDLPEGIIPESQYKPKSPGLPDNVVPESQLAKPTAEAPDIGLLEMSPATKQGMTFGFHDELAGAARAVHDFERTLTGTGSIDKAIEAAKAGYTSGREEDLAKLKAWEEAHPYRSTATELLGGLVTGGAMASEGAAMGRVGQLFERLPGWLKSTGLGALWGSVYGAGTSEPGHRMSGAAIGGTAGAVTGGVIHGTVKGVQLGAKGIRDYAAARANPRGQAALLIGEKMRADELNPVKLRARLRELGPQATLADAGGENILGLARGAAGQPGPAKNRIMQTLQKRAEGEASRIVNQVKTNIGPADYFASEDSLLSKLSAGANKAYRVAYEENPSIMTKSLNRMLRSPTMKRALKEAADIAEIERASGQSSWLGPVDKELTDMARYARDLGKMEAVPQPGIAKGFSLETWDQVKRGVDSLLDKPAYRNELTGRLNKKGKAINDLRKALVEQLDKATGGEKSLYVHARKQYGDTAETIEALRDGVKFMRLAPEQITKRLAGLSEAGKTAYRNGAARAIVDIVEGVPDTASAANRLFNKSVNRAKIRAIFPKNKDFADFSRSVIAEQRFAKTKNAIGAGSRTAPMSEEIADAQRRIGNLGAVLGSAMPGGGHALVKAGIGRRMLQSLLGSPEAMNREIAKALMTRNAAEQRLLLDALTPHLAERKDISPLLRALVFGATQQETKAINE